MQQILDAILAGASGDDIADLPLPESYRAAFVAAGRAGDVRRARVRRQGPAQVAARRRGRHARAGARRGLSWRSWRAPSTSTRCGPRSSSRCRPSASSTASARRASGAPATTCRTTSSAPTPRAWCCGSGSAVRNWKPGDRVIVHCNYVDDQDPSAHDDSMLAANQRIWGFETNFGGLADLAVVKANQLMPKPAHLTWEEAACNALCNSHALPHDRRHARGRHEAGRRRAHLGRHRRHRRLRRAVRPQRRRHAGRRGVVAGEGRAAAGDGLRARHRPQGQRLPVLGRRAHPGREASGGASARTSAASSGETPTSCSSTPAARPWARRCSSPPAAARSSPAPPPPAT